MNQDDVVGRLRRVDLNLLVALQALFEARSVTRAGERLGVTQSAMSHTLKRLRSLFDDPLLVRGEGGLGLTPRAEALAQRLPPVLRAVEAAFEEPEGFDPATSRRVFRLAAPDLFDALVYPRLLSDLAVEAPGVRIEATSLRADLASALQSGELDLAIRPRLVDRGWAVSFGPELHPDLIQRKLFADRFLSFVRMEHPVSSRERLSAQVFAGLDHVLVSAGDRGPGVVDAALQARGLERNVRFRVPTFSTAVALAVSTDATLTGPGALSQFDRRLRPLRVDLALPDHALLMVWHRRVDRDPAHQWIRRRLDASAAPLAASLAASRPRRSRRSGQSGRTKMGP